MRKEIRPDLRLAKDTVLDVPQKSAGSKTGSKRAAISGYGERHRAIEAAGVADNIQPYCALSGIYMACKRSGVRIP